MSNAPRLAGTVPNDGSSSHAATVVKWIAAILTPTALTTALAFWFGLVYTTARMSYLGLDVSALGFSTTDYILRSPDAAIVPVAVILTVILSALGLHGAVVPFTKRARWASTLRIAIWVLIAIGAISLALGLGSMFVPIFSISYNLLPPILLGLGPACIAYGYYLRKLIGSPAQRTASSLSALWERSSLAIVSLMGILAMFWGTSIYATGLGLGRAQLLEQNLSSRPEATVYSKSSLSLTAPVVENTLSTKDEAYKYKYTGMRLLLRSDGRYFLIPDGWIHGKGNLVVLPEDANTRFEFTSGDGSSG